MRRRTVLSTVSCGFVLTGGGCLSSDDPENGCPDTRTVQEEFTDELPHETYELEWFHDIVKGVFLFTEGDEREPFERGILDEELLTDEDKAWVEETDFTENVLLAIQVLSSSESSDLKIYGVERSGIHDKTVHVYSCIDRPGETDDWAPFARLLRVPHEGEPPDSARLTHAEGENSLFFA